MRRDEETRVKSLRGRVLGSLLCSIAVTSLASGCASDRPRMEIPPAGASPQEVVTAYVKAINTGDKSAGRALSTPSYRMEDVTDSWFNGARITNLKIEPPAPGGEERDGADRPYKETKYIAVHFDLHQREEISMLNGPTVWSWTVVRNSSDQPWRINNGGTG